MPARKVYVPVILAILYSITYLQISRAKHDLEMDSSAQDNINFTYCPILDRLVDRT